MAERAVSASVAVGDAARNMATDANDYLESDCAKLLHEELGSCDSTVPCPVRVGVPRELALRVAAAAA